MQIELLHPWSSTVASNFGDSDPSAANAREAQKSSDALAGPLDSLAQIPRLRFEEIAHGGQRVLIQYGDAVYELKSTRNGRLVLNK